MRKSVIVSAGVVLVAALGWTVVRPAVTASRFQMVIAQTPTGYAATCQTGCAWQSLTFECEAECRTVIDANGVFPKATTRQGDPDFAFQFQRTAEGWSLESLGGTRWKGLTWSCGGSGCPARVTESGVSGPA